MNRTLANIKRLLCVAFISWAAVFSAAALSEDNIFLLEPLGINDLNEFEEELSDNDAVKEIISQLFEQQGLRITGFLPINEENAEDADYDAIDLVALSLDETYSDIVSNGDSFLAMVMDGIYENGMTFWVMFIIYSDEECDFFYYPYYIEIESSNN